MFYLLELLIALNFPNVKSVRISQFRQWLDDQTSAPLILDARSQEEYAVSHLKSAQLIEVDNPDVTVLPEVPSNINIVVYCSVGYRSARVVKKLQQAGYQNVFNLSGGIFEWVNRGEPVFKDNHPVEAVHPYNFLWGRLLKSKYHR
ncbi:MAG: rhodanese-like domain-containing protein [Cyanobacteriota bacterium]|nr:rhodanese-like domain-containing protein [Cyanobacteriota bacterium]